MTIYIPKTIAQKWMNNPNNKPDMYFLSLPENIEVHSVEISDTILENWKRQEEPNKKQILHD